MQLLDDYIRQEVQKPFSYTLRTDCVGTVARWIEIQKGYCFLDQFDINYSTVDEKDGILHRNINFWQAIIRYARMTGEKITKEPVKGDVAAIVVPPNKVGLAIHCGSYWFTRDTKGIIGLPVDTTKVLRAWKIGND